MTVPRNISGALTGRLGAVRAWQRAPGADDLLAAMLWIVAVIPSAFGFWLVAGDLAGVPPADTRTLVFAAMLTLGLTTLAQVGVGYRALMYEGPSAGYLAAIVVITAGGHDLGGVTGGMIVAGAAAVVLGLLRFDRLLRPLLTPLTGMVFVLVVCVAVIPATGERAIGSSSAHDFGTAAAWISSATVVAVGLLLGRVRALRSYALLGALLAGTAVAFAIDGIPHTALSGGLATPELMPWGSPDFSAGVIAPFLIAALIVAFNEIAAIHISAEAFETAPAPDAGRRGLAVHGVTQAAGAVLGNVLGTVARLDSVPIVRLLANRRRAALALAALLCMALAFVEPFLGIVAALPLNVSAALLLFMLTSLVAITLGRVWVMGPRARIVAAVALLPSIAWTPLQDSLSPTAQLVGNPMLWGVGMGILLERGLARRDRIRSLTGGIA